MLCVDLRLMTVCHGDLWPGNLTFTGLDCSLLQPRAAASLSPATDLVHLVLTSGMGHITHLGRGRLYSRFSHKGGGVGGEKEIKPERFQVPYSRKDL